MNKYYSISYKLSSIKDGVKEFKEETSDDMPFVFISGFSTTIPGFEAEIEKLAKGDDFDFIIPCAEAYGDYNPEHVIKLDKPEGNEFQIEIGAIVPLQNEDGQRFMGHITAIEDNKVTIDLNHPLAGCDLNFTGKVLECREATNEEISQMINMISGGGCHGGCGNCSGSCHGEEGGCGNCGEGGCHGEEGGCGNCGK